MTATTDTTEVNAYDVLAERGLIAQQTDERLRQRLARPVTAYAGFDPTAESLHVGHLLPIMGLAHLQRCGHRPIALVGGATGLVGDPSGKTEARRMLREDQVRANAEAIGAQIGRFLRFGDDPTGAVLVNNLDWIGPLTWLEVLRDIGSRVSVNRMVTMDYVARRLSGEGEGISYLEFSYMLLQAYDFVHLHRAMGCTVQIAGQDQWGNIVMGIELARKLDEAELAGLTMPLVTKADGGKFGKTESGTVWLSAERTPPYEFYQFFRNTADADVARYLACFTFEPMGRVRELTAEGGAALNRAKEELAYAVTKLVHGQAEAEAARDSARKAFGSSRDVTGQAIPHAELSASELAEGVGLLTLMVRAGLASSNSEARRHVQGGAVRVHDEPVSDPRRAVTSADVREGYVLLRVGKKRLFRFDVV